MRLGQKYVQIQRCCMKCPKMLRGLLTLRLGLLLAVAISFIFGYLVYYSQEQMKLETLPLQENTGHYYDSLGNMKRGKADQSRGSKIKAVETNPDYFSHPAGETKGSNVIKSSSTTIREGGEEADVKNNSSVSKYLSDFLTNVSTRTQAVVPIKCDPSQPVSELLKAVPIKFLPNFKNPCWRERIDTPIEELYADNAYSRYSNAYAKHFSKLRKTWLSLAQPPTYRLRCLPYFFLAGQPKCGSTDFYNRIVSHPDVVTPPTKECHWWGKNRYGWCFNYTTTIPFSQYIDLYDAAAIEMSNDHDEPDILGLPRHSKITGDASVSTLWSNDDWWMNPENCGKTEPVYTTAKYINLLLPQARIIVILRNPTDRLYSDFLFFQHAGKSQEYFHKEVESAINNLNDCTQKDSLRACIYNHTIAGKSRVRLRLGLYQVYLKEWMSLFPREQVMVVRLEDYSQRPLTTIKLVHKFLDLRSLSVEEHEEVLEQPVLNTRRESDRKLGRMLPETRRLLDNFYRPYNAELAKLLGDDRFLWNS